MADPVPHPSSQDLPISLPFRTATMNARKPQRFALKPDKAALKLLAQLLDITAVHQMTFVGEIRSAGKRDFVLEARLDAKVEQPCGITLVPVETVIHEQISRRYVADMPLPKADEVEIPADSDEEPLPDVIDAGAVAAEALALALPLYPRAPGAELATAQFAPPGVAPLADGDLKPFAKLAGLAGLQTKAPETDPAEKDQDD